MAVVPEDGSPRPIYLGESACSGADGVVWVRLTRPWLPLGGGPKMASFFVYGYVGRLWSHLQIIEHQRNDCTYCLGCFLFTGASGQGTGHSDLCQLRLAGWVTYDQKASRELSEKALLTGHSPSPGDDMHRQSPASRPHSVQYVHSQQHRYCTHRDFLRGSILLRSITHTHTKMLTMWGHTHITYLACDDHFTMYTSIKNIKVYTFNTYNFYLSVTSQ